VSRRAGSGSCAGWMGRWGSMSGGNTMRTTRCPWRARASTSSSCPTTRPMSGAAGWYAQAKHRGARFGWPRALHYALKLTVVWIEVGATKISSLPSVNEMSWGGEKALSHIPCQRLRTFSNAYIHKMYANIGSNRRKFRLRQLQSKRLYALYERYGASRRYALAPNRIAARHSAECHALHHCPQVLVAIRHGSEGFSFM
jgi:hypothetical protein